MNVPHAVAGVGATTYDSCALWGVAVYSVIFVCDDGKGEESIVNGMRIEVKTL
jgi:hypothetical protein